MVSIFGGFRRFGEKMAILLLKTNVMINFGVNYQ
jgi:hypothetical protein